jgi:hypothetical protein
MKFPSPYMNPPREPPKPATVTEHAAYVSRQAERLAQMKLWAKSRLYQTPEKENDNA